MEFTLDDERFINFLFQEGAVTPRNRDGTQAEITATFRVENRGPRSVRLATYYAWFRYGEQIPIQTITGLNRCPDTGSCSARAISMAPGAAITLSLAARVALRSAADPQMEELRGANWINVGIGVKRFWVPGDPSYYAPSAGREATYDYGFHFQHSRGAMNNTMPGRS